MPRNPVKDIQTFDIPNPFKPRVVVDVEWCTGRLNLLALLRVIECSGYTFLCATQSGEEYTVFFRRPAP